MARASPTAIATVVLAVGRKIHGAGFFLNADVQDHVAGFGERGMNFAGQRDERHLKPLQSFQQTKRFSSVSPP